MIFCRWGLDDASKTVFIWFLEFFGPRPFLWMLLQMWHYQIRFGQSAASDLRFPCLDSTISFLTVRKSGKLMNRIFGRVWLLLQCSADNSLWSFRWTSVMMPLYMLFLPGIVILCFCKLVLMTLKPSRPFHFKNFPLYPLYIWGPKWTCLYRNCISVFVVQWSKAHVSPMFLSFYPSYIGWIER